MSTDWKKNCPKCGSEQTYSNKKNFRKAVKKELVCKHCRYSVDRSIKISRALKGKIFTDEHKRKLSESKIGKPSYIRSEETKKKNSECQIGNLNHKFGKKLNDYEKQCQSIRYKGQLNPFFGKTHSEETKLKLRINKLKRLEELGISGCEDKGAKEWFDKYNEETNSNFIPTTFMGIGYRADGYDENKHVWIEYDTPYHNRLKYRHKDFIRQTNIIKHFENIGEPLVEFIRVDVSGKNPILKTVYRGYEYA